VRKKGGSPWANLNIAYGVQLGDRAVRMVAEGGAGVTTELMTGIPYFP
jgi:hypothetical protein